MNIFPSLRRISSQQRQIARRLARSKASPGKPNWLLLGSEPWRATSEYLWHRWQQAWRAAGPAQGDGHPVLIFPGLASDQRAVAPLQRSCQAWGFPAYDWGRGFNTGAGNNVQAWLRSLADDLTSMLREHQHDQAPTLIGWSLGGIYARELAKEPGFKVRQVITIGTPFNARPGQTHADRLYRLLNGGASLTPQWRRRLRTPPPVPTTSIYSKSDGIVAWQACLHDKPYPQVDEIAVPGSHLGMGWNEAVLQVVRDKLLLHPASR